ncbi:MAG: aldose 1-epimerase family protein [Chitinophagaceae bacterium]|nr:aldose 1-epimerase family protein [Chitinophagaceae bacterium]
MITLENENIKIAVKTKGAELDSLFSKGTNLEYLWSGDAKFWNKKSPILFPIVGQLKQNTYFYKNKAYILTRHGFARDMEFTITAQSDQSATFTLTDDENTLRNFPFPFILDVTYSLDADTVHVKYRVANKGENNMFFSIGAHPAFRVPLDKKRQYDDYYFEFEQIEDGYRWQVSSEGLIEPNTIPFLINTNKLPITRELFRNDAVVFKYLNSGKVTLKSNKSKYGVEVSYPGFPFIGLWAAPGADFVCIEPWCGIADSTTSKQELINKEGINLLTPSQAFERTWSVRLF